MFEKSKWIWQNTNAQNDEYADFYCDFEYSKNGAVLYISADSNYVAYINGQLAAFGQYADFPHDKVYDEIDISEYCKKGTNRIDITVWYYGIETTSVYCKGNAALRFEIKDNDNNVLAKSDIDTFSRINPNYKNHYCKIITPQLGYSFLYNAENQSTDFDKSVLVNQELPLRKRPNKKLITEDLTEGKFLKKVDETTYLFDLQSETVGFIYFDIDCEKSSLITISYGEHIADGRVRRIIDSRDFSVEYISKEKNNIFLNPFRRLGARYLELHCETSIKINKIGIIPTVYPLSEQTPPKLFGIHKEIYDICVNTLKLCMHEHYEDCPWREQALYTMDSRNQMLCGYYAFKEYEFARSCLELISKDNRQDGLLSICYPKSDGKVIPSFSLHYITEVYEYYLHSKDIGLLKQVFGKIQSVLQVFTERLSNGLIYPFSSENAWNFYEWQPTLDGKTTDLNVYDLILNAFLSSALQTASKIGDILGIETNYKTVAANINTAINDTFYDENQGIYLDFDKKGSTASILGNCAAILCNAAAGKERAICEKVLNNKNLIPCSLSMLCFKYDAFIKTDINKYKSIIIDEIEKVFTPMVELGNKTVWETEKGESDFKKAGSLCHGWSAMPVYYYNILGE